MATCKKRSLAIECWARTMFKSLFNLVVINLKVRYRGTLTGFIWVILHPILLFFVQSYIFSNFFGHEISNYSLYLMTGLFPWFFLSQTADMSCNHLKTNSSLIQCLNIKPEILILALVIENYIHFLFAVLIVAGYLIFKDFNSIVPVSIMLAWSLPFVILAYYLSFISSLLNTLYKDVKFILSFIFTILFFSSPVIYRSTNLPVRIQNVIALNPLNSFLSMFRSGLNPNDTENLMSPFITCVLIIIALGFTKKYLWHKLHNSFLLKI